jgi:lipopolysaccharide transport system ATP-binding protein
LLFSSEKRTLGTTSISTPSPIAPAFNLNESREKGNRSATPQSNLDIAVSASGLSKKFKVYPNPGGRLVEWLTAGRAVRHSEFWALQDIDFEIKKGESLGVIGVNGSGKTTLLKLLTGTLIPTAGTFTVTGRVLSLIEMGTGLNMELTGRQNIYNCSQMLNFPAGYAEARVEDIAAFSELGEFFDRPVKIYSSGMLVRLTFSMFAFFDPEVFIVDEALSVGDVFFQQKCIKLIRSMLDRGVTMIFVTHDFGTVVQLCQRTLVLHNSRAIFLGESAAACDKFYEARAVQLQNAQPAAARAAPPFPAAPAPRAEPQANGLEFPKNLSLRNWTSKEEIGNRDIEIIHCAVTDPFDVPGDAFAVGQAIKFRIWFKANRDVEDLNAGFEIQDRFHTTFYALTNKVRSQERCKMSRGQVAYFETILDGRFGAGDFLLNVGVGTGDDGYGVPTIHYHRISAVFVFKVYYPNDRYHFLGPCDLNASFEWSPGISKLPSNSHGAHPARAADPAKS